MKARARPGMVMLEVILGVAILGMVGVGLVTLLTQTVQTVRQGRAAERRTESAVQLLDRVILWSESELASRLGRSRMGVWNLDVATPRARLYTLAVLDTLSGATVLRTTVYRP
ncbi:MAG TPA: type II secretion system protein [Gemmatimonadaceae bacterium]|nr:type II secretion system protein [Gemmatimonadaceae bacterium]